MGSALSQYPIRGSTRAAGNKLDFKGWTLRTNYSQPALKQVTCVWTCQVFSSFVVNPPGVQYVPIAFRWKHPPFGQQWRNMAVAKHGGGDTSNWSCSNFCAFTVPEHYSYAIDLCNAQMKTVRCLSPARSWIKEIFCHTASIPWLPRPWHWKSQDDVPWQIIKINDIDFGKEILRKNSIW